jgi:biopolymer transport protein ExbD
MARIFRRRRELHPVAELNVTNMVDLGFTLLIIFMITTPLIQQEQTIPVNLPGESKKAQTPPENDYQTISVDENNNVYLGSKRVTMTELGANLSVLANKPKQPVIRIRADMSLQWQQVVRIMDEIKKHNLTKITFDTESK